MKVTKNKQTNTKIGSVPQNMGFPCGSAGKESACDAGDLGSIPGWGRSPGEEKGYPLQYSGLENSMECIVHGVTKSRTRLSDFHFTWNMVRREAGQKYESVIIALQRGKQEQLTYYWYYWRGAGHSGPCPSCHTSPHVLCLPFPYGKLQSKTKFNQKSEKYGNQKKKKTQSEETE